VFTGFWLGGLKARDHCEDLGVGGRIKLRWSELDSAGSGWGPAAGFCDHGNEPSGSIKKAGLF
jgi:hypothetical protein